MLLSAQSSYKKFLLEDLYNQNEGQYDFSLSAACMPAMSLSVFLDEFYSEEKENLERFFLDLSLDYSSQYGFLELRQCLAENLYPSLESENLFITNGGAEAIFLLFNSIFEAGDTVIVQRPIYQSLFQILEDRGLRLINFGLSDDLENLLLQYPEAKALIINNPNNPCGTAYDGQELKKISELLGENRFLIADEIFHNASLLDLESVINIHPKSIVLSGLSKAYYLPGLRIGWLACSDKEILQRVSSLKNYLSIRNSTLSEHIALLAIRARGKIMERNRKLIKENIDYIKSLSIIGEIFDLNVLDGIKTFTSFTKLNSALMDKYGSVDNYSKYLLEERKTFLLQGSVFGDEYKDYCRLAFGSIDGFKHLIAE